MKVLVVNAGSSSLKYQVIEMDNEIAVASGIVEQIGSEISNIVYKHDDKKYEHNEIVADHITALQKVIALLCDKENGVLKDISEIKGIGHRVLHSGEDFTDSVLVDENVLKICKKNKVFGPLHMPANIGCIEACQNILPGVPNVAVFDTSFHLTMEKDAYMYAIPYEYYEKYKIRKYGFHGTSHKYVSEAVRDWLGAENCKKIITCHLGNGSSLAAIKDGKCIDTSMGLTPLEGLVMGTRSGDIDPAVVEFIATVKKVDVQEVLRILNKESGFFGICRESDCRRVCKLIDAGDEKAKLALDMFAHSIKKYIGSYFIELGGLDTLVFTGGIGENSDYCRKLILTGLECLGVDVDFDLNTNMKRGIPTVISTEKSKVKVVVLPTNEELVIARDTVKFGNLK